MKNKLSKLSTIFVATTALFILAGCETIIDIPSPIKEDLKKTKEYYQASAKDFLAAKEAVLRAQGKTDEANKIAAELAILESNPTASIEVITTAIQKSEEVKVDFTQKVDAKNAEARAEAVKGGVSILDGGVKTAAMGLKVAEIVEKFSKGSEIGMGIMGAQILANYDMLEALPAYVETIYDFSVAYTKYLSDSGIEESEITQKEEAVLKDLKNAEVAAVAGKGLADKKATEKEGKKQVEEVKAGK